MDDKQFFEAMSRTDYNVMLKNAYQIIKEFLELAALVRPDVPSASDDVAIHEIAILTVGIAMQSDSNVSDALGSAATAYIIKLREQ